MALDPISINKSLWVGYRIYIWFVLATFSWTGVRIIRVWLQVPPFSSKARQSSDLGYLKGWRVLARSAGRWAGLVL